MESQGATGETEPGDKESKAMNTSDPQNEGMREFERLDILLSQIPRKAQLGIIKTCDLVLTCIDANEKFIALGTNVGMTFLYSRKNESIQRLKATNQTAVITSVSLHDGIDDMVAMGTASGDVTVFCIPGMVSVQKKQIQKFDVQDIHKHFITCLRWSTNGMKLYSGDKHGQVAVTDVDFYQGVSKSSCLLIEAATEIIQMDYLHRVLLVSTRHRSFVVRLDRSSEIAQIGTKDRKTPGPFGACFVPELCKAEDMKLFAARPGCRLWLSDVSGLVKSTHIFGDVLSPAVLEIPVLAARRLQSPQDGFQFSKVKWLREAGLVTWSHSVLVMLDPFNNRFLGRLSRLSGVVDVAVVPETEEIFLLQRHADARVIRISNRPEVKDKVATTLLPSVLAPESIVEQTSTPALPEQKEELTAISIFKKIGLPLKRQVQRLVPSEEEVTEPDLAPKVAVPQTEFTPDPLPPIEKIASPELDGLRLFTGKDDSVLSKPSNESSVRDLPDDIPTSPGQGGIVFSHRMKKPKKKKQKEGVSRQPEVDSISQQSNDLVSISSGATVDSEDESTMKALKDADDVLNMFRSLVTNKAEKEETQDSSVVLPIQESSSVSNPAQGGLAGKDKTISSTAESVTSHAGKDKAISSSAESVTSHAGKDKIIKSPAESVESHAGKDKTIKSPAESAESHAQIGTSFSEASIKIFDNVEGADNSSIPAKKILENRGTEQADPSVGSRKALPRTESPRGVSSGDECKVNEQISGIPKAEVLNRADPEDKIDLPGCLRKTDGHSSSHPKTSPKEEVIEESFPDRINNSKIASDIQDRLSSSLAEADQHMKKSSSHEAGSPPHSSGRKRLSFQSSFDTVNSAFARVYQAEKDEVDDAKDHSENCERSEENICEEEENKKRPSLVHQPSEFDIYSEVESIEALDPFGRKGMEESHADDFYSIYLDSMDSIESENASISMSTSRKGTQTSRLSSETTVSDLSGDAGAQEEGMAVSPVANSWSEFTTPANIYSLAVSEQHVWFTDKSENIYYSSLHGAKGIVWRKATGYASQISVSPQGSIVWRLHKGVVYAGTKISTRHPEGLKWVEAVRDVQYMTVHVSCAWYIKRSGEVYMQYGLSKERPCYRSHQVDCGPYRLKQITCGGPGVVWAVTEGLQLLVRSGVTDDLPAGEAWEICVRESPPYLFSHVSIDNEKVGWAIDVSGQIWFCTGVTQACPRGDGVWWQVPMSGYVMQDESTLDMIRSVARKFDPYKLSQILSTNRGGLITAGCQGVWLAMDYRNLLQVCRGTVQGYHWRFGQPAQVSASSVWRHVCASTNHLEGGQVWAQHMTRKMFAFKQVRGEASLLPECGDLACIAASPAAIWILSSDGNIRIRTGMVSHCPLGTGWAELDMSQLGDAHFVHLSCNALYVWAVELEGGVYQRIGANPPSQSNLNPVWLPIDNFSDIVFTKIYVGPLDWMVWAVDNRRLFYVRVGITESMPIGNEWMHVPGLQAMDMVITRSGVWALNTQGEIFFRYGVTPARPEGDYWKKIPGTMAKISASANDELWGISPEGQLMQCKFKLLLRKQSSSDTFVSRPLSRDISFTDDWEMV